MPPKSFIQTVVLFILALLLVQGAAALSIEQAPLNPAFVAYQEGQDTDDILYATGCCGRTGAATGTPFMPYATGDIPAPVVMTWPDTDSTENYQATATDDVTFPARYDLRDEGRVTPVRDQGDCGSCWTFAAYGSLESTYLSDTGLAENFSENNMKNLCSDLYPDGYDRAPCNGGNAFMSAAYLARGSGPIREEDDPYILPVPSNISPTGLPPFLDTYEVTFLPTRTDPLENALFKQILMEEGAVRIRFLVNYSCFSGNGTTYYRPDTGYPSLGGHAVTLVGWDDAFPKEEFVVTPPGDGAFILKNSWGTGFGDGGYFYISYYDRSLDTSESTVFTGVVADDERRTYQYDPLGWTDTIGTGTATTIYAANVFTAEDYEALIGVSFYTIEPGTDYTVAVFTDFTTPPGDAAPVAWTSGTTALPGYHTCSLPTAVPLMPGEDFTVVLRIDAPTETHPLAVEMPIPGYSSNATAGPGESYVSADGDEWVDLTEFIPDTNVCIKAHTKPLTVVPRDYPTIMDAVNASTPGDTIIVGAGTYPEYLEIEKPLTLQGVGTPVVTTAEDQIGAVFVAEDITMAGLSFDGNDEGFGGIGIFEDNCTLYDTTISGYQDGLHIGYVRGLSLSTVALLNNTNNIEFTDLAEDAGNSIDETVTVNGRPVIYREGVSGVCIDASSDAGAIICVNCTDLTIRDTTTEAIADGIKLSSCRNVVVENVTADRIDSGVRVEYSENIIVQDSSFGPECRRGMGILATTGFLADANEIACQDNSQGIRLSSTENVTIADNSIDSGTDGVGVLGTMLFNTTVDGNILQEGTDLGILVLYAENMSVTGNTMNITTFGALIDSGYGVTISDNTIRGNDTAVGFGIVADGAEVTHNTLDNCSAPTLMILNDSVIRENHFTGKDFPIIDVVENGTDVYVYRNNFVLTPDAEGEADAQMTSAASAASAIITGSCREGQWTIPEIPSIPDRWPDACREDIPGGTSHIGAFMNMAEGCTLCTATAAATPQQATVGHVGWDEAVWHSPAEETYWYRGQPYTRTPGNYWNLYNGTDTTGDGIGDTPYLYDNDTIDSYPLVKPFTWYRDENPDAGGNDPSDDIATAGAMQAGDAATFSFTGTAVEEVAITAADRTGRVVLTVDAGGSGPKGLSGQVYQYLTVQLSGMTDADVRDAVISFRVPAAWLRAEGLVPADMALFRYHDGAWQELSTTVVREDGGWVHFAATTPGFSTFAIAEGGTLTATIDSIPDMMGPGPEIGEDTADGAVPSTTIPTGETTPEPQVTVAVPDETEPTTPVADATTPQESPAGLFPLIGAGAVLCVFLRRH